MTLALTRYYNIMTVTSLIGTHILVTSCNPDAKRLYDDLMRKRTYNKHIMPPANGSQLTVNVALRLSQLLDLDERNQIMTANVWLRQEWYDSRLSWQPSQYGGVDRLFVLPHDLWLPDIVLFNNADGNYEFTLLTKALLRHDGHVRWEPPAITRSSCTVDVTYFPFDEQLCALRFASWTYDGTEVDLRQMTLEGGTDEERCGASAAYFQFFSSSAESHGELRVTEHLDIDLADFYPSVEWDLMTVSATRTVTHSSATRCCNHYHRPSSQPDVTFAVLLRRKTLFHTINLLIPCVSISFLTVLVFYLPSQSSEKISLSISILLSLTVFFLVLSETIPPTSLVVPLIGKFLIFTTMLVTLSTLATVIVLNIHFRLTHTRPLPRACHTWILVRLARLLAVTRPQATYQSLSRTSSHRSSSMSIWRRRRSSARFSSSYILRQWNDDQISDTDEQCNLLAKNCSSELSGITPSHCSDTLDVLPTDVKQNSSSTSATATPSRHQVELHCEPPPPPLRSGLSSYFNPSAPLHSVSMGCYNYSTSHSAYSTPQHQHPTTQTNVTVHSSAQQQSTSPPMNKNKILNLWCVPPTPSHSRLSPQHTVLLAERALPFGLQSTALISTQAHNIAMSQNVSQSSQLQAISTTLQSPSNTSSLNLPLHQFRRQSVTFSLPSHAPAANHSQPMLHDLPKQQSLPITSHCIQTQTIRQTVSFNFPLSNASGSESLLNAQKASHIESQPLYSDSPLSFSKPQYSPSADDELSCGAHAADNNGGSVPLKYHSEDSEAIWRSLENVRFIAKHVREEEKRRTMHEDWKYAAMVLDRLFLAIFSAACITATISILLQAPSIYDTRPHIC